MGLEYLQIWADMEELFQPYDDAQRGRLIMAMMAYAYRGEEPEFAGVEKFIWPVLRQHIDRCTQSIEAKKAAGSKGGKGSKTDKQTQADGSKSKQNEAEVSKAKQTEAEESEIKQNAHTQYQYHDQYHTHYHNHNEEECNTCAREGAPASSPADEGVIGIDGTDLSAEIALNAEVDVLLRQYKLSESVRGGLMDEITKHGLDKVKRVMQEAAESDTKGGLSLRFIRACLANDGKQKPQRAAPGSGKAFDQMLRYTPEERKKTIAAAILDFDDEMG